MMLYESIIKNLNSIKEYKKIIKESGYNAPYDYEILQAYKKEIYRLLKLYIQKGAKE